MLYSGTDLESYITEHTLVYVDKHQLHPDLSDFSGTDMAGRCRANSALIRQSGPDSGPGFRVKVLKHFEGALPSLESGCI